MADFALFSRYRRIFALYDSDPAGEAARESLYNYPRIQFLTLPVHDLIVVPQGRPTSCAPVATSLPGLKNKSQ